MNHLDYCDALEIEVERFAATMSQVPGNALVTACPGWTVDDVALHLGTIHRWANELVRTRATARIPRTTSTLDEVAVSPEWLRRGGLELVSTLRDANPDEEMWAWGFDQHVRFWSRRQVHETLVHRIDLELAGHIEPTVEASLASDAIDEFLRNLQKVTDASNETALRGTGQRLVFRAKDADTAWTITLLDGGFDLGLETHDVDTLVEGPSLDLLLAMVRRRSVLAAGLDVSGDSELSDFWLANSAYD
jgi:uncharacterized protein (TIGR03083 family)